ncbi:hypothetical protein BDV93DRAFT_585973 [Ceratobasidium sp. AG-I]|nr:hypothetical protein BDV93DRAFT_585973 [Ceratobasidium sp. AG-I]
MSRVAREEEPGGGIGEGTRRREWENCKWKRDWWWEQWRKSTSTGLKQLRAVISTQLDEARTADDRRIKLRRCAKRGDYGGKASEPTAQRSRSLSPQQIEPTRNLEETQKIRRFEGAESENRGCGNSKPQAEPQNQPTLGSGFKAIFRNSKNSVLGGLSGLQIMETLPLVLDQPMHSACTDLRVSTNINHELLDYINDQTNLMATLAAMTKAKKQNLPLDIPELMMYPPVAAGVLLHFLALIRYPLHEFSAKTNPSSPSRPPPFSSPAHYNSYSAAHNQQIVAAEETRSQPKDLYPSNLTIQPNTLSSAKGKDNPRKGNKEENVQSGGEDMDTDNNEALLTDYYLDCYATTPEPTACITNFSTNWPEASATTQNKSTAVQKLYKELDLTSEEEMPRERPEEPPAKKPKPRLKMVSISSPASNSANAAKCSPSLPEPENSPAPSPPHSIDAAPPQVNHPIASSLTSPPVVGGSGAMVPPTSTNPSKTNNATANKPICGLGLASLE